MNMKKEDIVKILNGYAFASRSDKWWQIEGKPIPSKKWEKYLAIKIRVETAFAIFDELDTANRKNDSMARTRVTFYVNRKKKRRKKVSFWADGIIKDESEDNLERNTGFKQITVKDYDKIRTKWLGLD